MHYLSADEGRVADDKSQYNQPFPPPHSQECDQSDRHQHGKKKALMGQDVQVEDEGRSGIPSMAIGVIALHIPDIADEFVRGNDGAGCGQRKRQDGGDRGPHQKGRLPEPAGKSVSRVAVTTGRPSFICWRGRTQEVGNQDRDRHHAGVVLRAGGEADGDSGYQVVKATPATKHPEGSQEAKGRVKKAQ